MKTKVLYILTSSEHDYYLEQVFLSIYSLLLYNPEAHVVLLTDKETEASLTEGRRVLLDYVKEFIVVDIPAKYNQFQRSRYLKTSMRQHVQGDFIYIDTDTIVCKDISSIDTAQYEIGGVADMHYTQVRNNPCHLIGRRCETIGLKLPDDYTYINSGVLYAKDTETAHTLFSKWHTYWAEGVEKGLILDQPSLAKADIDMGVVLYDMDGTWDCQITGNCLPYIINAKVIHYFTTKAPEEADNSKMIFSRLSFWKEFKEHAFGNDEAMKEIIRNAKHSFSSYTAIYGGSDLRIINSDIYDFLCKLYYEDRKAFHKLNKSIPQLSEFLNQLPE